MKRKTMKKKCNYCKIIFSFKTKDLKLSKNQKRNIEYTTYTINCPFCYTTKEVFINHTPHKIFNDINNLNILANNLNKSGIVNTGKLIKEFTNKDLFMTSRKSRIEIINSTKETIKNNDILDKIISQNIVKQLVSNLDYPKNNKLLLYFISLISFTFLLITILIL